MTPKERFRALVKGRQPDRIPTDYWATQEVTDRLLRDLGCADEEALWRRLHVDKIHEYTSRWKVPHHPDDPQADPWGCRYRTVDYGTGQYEEIANHPLAHCQTAEDVHRFRWPTPDDMDYGPIRDALAADDGQYPINAGRYEPFLLYAYLRGLEQSFEDLLLQPEVADAILGHLFDFYHEHNRRILELGKGKFDVFYLAEDLGSQHGPLVSLETYRRFFRANQKRMADLVRSYGVAVFYHTDGAARVFLPDLVDYVGIEILNPVQYRCPGMEREALVRDFGRKIAFHGVMENQHVLPFGTVDEVRAEVRRNVEIFGGYRWICASCHNLQAVTPTENVVAMYETIHELGKL